MGTPVINEVRVQPRRRVSELMSSPPIMVDPDASVTEAADVLFTEAVGVVLVGSPEELLGVLSERDVTAAVAHGHEPSATPVGVVMHHPVVSIEADDTVLDAVLKAIELDVRHLPVRRDGLVVGVVSTRDLMSPLLLEALTPPV